MADREKFFKCDCHSEGMLITKFDNEEEMYFSYWRQGIDPIKLSWWMRLKLCWMALTKRNYFEDEIILNKEKAMELALWIQDEHKTKFAVGNLLDRKPLDPALEQDKMNKTKDNHITSYPAILPKIPVCRYSN